MFLFSEDDEESEEDDDDETIVANLMRRRGCLSILLKSFSVSIGDLWLFNQNSETGQKACGI